jgi:hypothetical protein
MKHWGPLMKEWYEKMKKECEDLTDEELAKAVPN